MCMADAAPSCVLLLFTNNTDTNGDATQNSSHPPATITVSHVLISFSRTKKRRVQHFFARTTVKPLLWRRP